MNYHRDLGNLKKNTVNGLGTKILSSGIFLPEKKVTSVEIFSAFDSENKFDLSKNWMVDNMGIIERRMCDFNSKPSDLAIPAAEQAIENFDGNIDEIDAVIFCGIERDQPEPSTAHTVQEKLGINTKYAFDVGDACFGFFDGLNIASSFIQSKLARLVLVVTGEVPTKLTRIIIDKANNGASKKELFDQLGFLSVGDAGGAMIIGGSGIDSNSGFVRFDSETLSEHSDLCYYGNDHEKGFYASMKMAKILSKGFRMHQKLFAKYQEYEQYEHPRFLLSHQVGKRAFEQIASLGVVPKERMIKSYDLFGNATSANLPLNYHQLITSGQANENDIILGCYNGSGLSTGQMTIRV